MVNDFTCILYDLDNYIGQIFDLDNVNYEFEDAMINPIYENLLTFSHIDLSLYKHQDLENKILF